MITKQYRLRSIIDRVVDYRGVTPTKLGFEWNEDKSGIPAVSALNIKRNQLVKHDEMNYVSDALYTAWMRQEVVPGDLLLTSEAPLGEMYIVRDGDKLCLSQRVFGLRTKKDVVDPKFLYYSLHSEHGQYRLYRRSSGSTAKGIRATELMQVEVNLPELAEQKTLTHFLDRKTNTIDKMITAKNHTRAQLSELRQATITEAVRTGVLIMNTPTVRLKSVARVLNGATPKSDKMEYWDGDVAWATPVDLSKLKNKFIESTSRTITQSGYLSCNTSLVQPGNIVLSNRAPIGLLAINKIPLCTNQGCKILLLDKKKIDARYLYYVLSSRVSDLQNLGTGTTFMEISADSIKNVEIPLPSPAEQRKIANEIDRKLSGLCHASDILTDSIKLLEEYRSSLITNVVGGKAPV